MFSILNKRKLARISFSKYDWNFTVTVTFTNINLGFFLLREFFPNFPENSTNKKRLERISVRKSDLLKFKSFESIIRIILTD